MNNIMRSEKVLRPLPRVARSRSAAGLVKTPQRIPARQAQTRNRVVLWSTMRSLEQPPGDCLDHVRPIIDTFCISKKQLDSNPAARLI
jgi:hypothetical protein